MNEEENDFFERCFGIVAGLEVGNEAQAIAKEVVLDEVENLQQENQQLKHILDELEKYLEEFDKSLCKTMIRDDSEFYHFQRGELVFLRSTKLKIKELRGDKNV